jgi:ATP-dependent RNA helicase DDX5/DBP2
VHHLVLLPGPLLFVTNFTNPVFASVQIVAQMPMQRQTLFFTATWPKEVRRIAADLLTNPAQVNIGNMDQLAANKAITQIVEIVTSYDKGQRLVSILRELTSSSKTLVFCGTKRMCDQLTRQIDRQFNAGGLGSTLPSPIDVWLWREPNCRKFVGLRSLEWS